MFLRRFSRKHGLISKGALEGSSDPNPREIKPPKLGRSPRNDFRVIIFTLDPNKFAEKEQRYLHIGHRHVFRPYVSLQRQSTPVLAPRMDYDTTSKDDTRRSFKRVPYPRTTKAFLYYSMLSEKPCIAGELRLRVTSSDDPASFESGSDLLRPNGRPWSRSLYVLSKFYPPLYEKLREERLVSDNLDKVLSTLPSKRPIYGQSRQRLYTLNDTFIIDFTSRESFFFVITEQGVETLPFLEIFFDNRGMWNGTPYTGSALARFERSTLLEHKGTRTVVLRFLKIITPVKCVMPLYDGYICCPKEGELHRNAPGNTLISNQPLAVWSFNIDKSKTQTHMRRGFKLLWDS